MSLARLVYFSAIVGGWAAFLGWLLAECLVLRGEGSFDIMGYMLVGALVGAPIGGGLNVVAGLSNTRLKNLLMRVPAGLLGGGVGGAVGILAGQLVYYVHLPRAFGFMLLGLGVGVVEGVYERSSSKIRNGVIGGLIGGLVGGFLFDPISTLLVSPRGIASRAAAFVILGICIGALVGLVQVVLKRASLRVLDGYGVGREIILSDPVTVLGRADHLRLPFLGPANAKLEPEHLRIVRRPDGSFTIEDNHSRLGVTVRSHGAQNYEDVQQPRTLRDGDVIRFGSNLVRFSQRKRRAQGETAEPTAGPAATGLSPHATPPPPPPPPPRRQGESATTQPSPTTQPPTAPSPTTSPGPSPQAAQPGSAPPPPPPPPRRRE